MWLFGERNAMDSREEPISPIRKWLGRGFFAAVSLSVTAAIDHAAYRLRWWEKTTEMVTLIEWRGETVEDFCRELETIQSNHPAPAIVFKKDWYDLVRDFRKMTEPELSQKLAELRTHYPNLAIEALIAKGAAFDVSFPNPSLVYNPVLPRVSLNTVVNSQRPVPKITIQGTDPFGNPSGILHEMEVKVKK